jgi:hypothetical protein
VHLRKSLLTAFAALLVALPGASAASDVADLFGTWTWTIPKTGCTMTRTFRSDGTTTVVNGKKTVTGTYVVRWNKARTGRTLASTIATDDGGQDCDGTKASAVGTRYLAYVFLERPGLFMCLDSARTSCLGPYQKR